MSDQELNPPVFQGFRGAKRGKRIPRGPTQSPIREIRVMAAPTKLVDRLKIIPKLPHNVIDLLLTSNYTLNNGTHVFLFGGFNNISGKTVPEFNTIEIQEAIGVYFTYLEQHNDEKLAKGDFFSYINGLIFSQKRKAERDLLTHHDIVFETPSLVEYRRQEIIKERISHRKKRPVKGKCGRSTCSSNEIYMEELFGIRSGDEGGVTILVCAKCGYKWTHGG